MEKMDGEVVGLRNVCDVVMGVTYALREGSKNARKVTEKVVQMMM